MARTPAVLAAESFSRQFFYVKSYTGLVLLNLQPYRLTRTNDMIRFKELKPLLPVIALRCSARGYYGVRVKKKVKPENYPMTNAGSGGRYGMNLMRLKGNFFLEVKVTHFERIA